MAPLAYACDVARVLCIGKRAAGTNEMKTEIRNFRAVLVRNVDHALDIGDTMLPFYSIKCSRLLLGIPASALALSPRSKSRIMAVCVNHFCPHKSSRVSWSSFAPHVAALRSA